jgi:hypothetical protein
VVSRDLADYLLGCWDVERALAEGGEEGTFTGVAEFSRAGGAVGSAGEPASGSADASADAPVSGSADASANAPVSGSADASANAPVSGSADASAGSPDRLSWDERGRMRWRGNDLEARRVLELVREAGGWEVRFDDGRPFHPLDLSTGSFAAVHPCGEDHYEGEYRVLGDDLFEVEWRVRGPRKDQRIHTRYRRL